MWAGKKGIPDSVSSALRLCKNSVFSNIHCALRLLATLPITSCKCERSISSLRCLKTYMRTSTSQERLLGLALMHVHYERCAGLDLEKVITELARKCPRRIALMDVLDDD